MVAWCAAGDEEEEEEERSIIMAVTPLALDLGEGGAALGGEEAVAPSAVNFSTSSASTAGTRRTERKPTNISSTHGEVGNTFLP